MKLSAYAVQGSDNFTRIEISKSMATAFSGIRGYLPEKMTVNLLSGNFADAVDSLLNTRVSINPVTPSLAK